MNYYIEIKNKLIDNEIYSKVKDYSNRLVVEFRRKYNERTLRRIRQYYDKILLTIILYHGKINKGCETTYGEIYTRYISKRHI